MVGLGCCLLVLPPFGIDLVGSLVIDGRVEAFAIESYSIQAVTSWAAY